MFLVFCHSGLRAGIQGMLDNTYFVYILASNRNGTLYIGVTSDLDKRIQEHKQGLFPGSFTAEYKVSKLVYYEMTNSVEAAFAREKQLKNWQRRWKLDLVEKNNPMWKDLSEGGSLPWMPDRSPA